jgi:hypothetical protein
MLRTITVVLALALSVGFTGCKGSEMVTGNPIGGGNQRTLAGMVPLINKALTTTTAEEKFGFPDQRTPPPQVVLTYNVEDGRKLSLVFPDLVGTILSAFVTEKNGGTTALAIPDP